MLNFVNVNGDPLFPTGRPQQKAVKKRDEKSSFHKGWRVVGIPPGEEAEAEREHAIKQKRAKGFEPFNRELWLKRARARSIRSRPYEIYSAAMLCAEIAKKNGWLRVEVIEVKKQEEKQKT